MRASTPILTVQPDSGILCPMKALLKDDLQAHMPAPPEKRLLINGCAPGNNSAAERGNGATSDPIIISGLGMSNIDKGTSEETIRKMLSEIKGRGFTTIWDASPSPLSSDILNDKAEMEHEKKFARLIREYDIGNAFGLRWELLLTGEENKGLKSELLGMTLDPTNGLPVYGKDGQRWNYGSQKALGAFRSRFVQLINELGPREMFFVDETALATPGPESHYRKMSSYWTSPTYTRQALDSFREYLGKIDYPNAENARFPVTTVNFAPCDAADMGLPAVPLNDHNRWLLQEDNSWPDSRLWRQWYSWREDIMTQWIDACATEAARAWGKSPYWLGTMVSAPDFWYDPALGLNVDKLFSLPSVDYVVAGYMSGNRFAKIRDVAIKHGKKWGTMVELCRYGQNKGVDPGNIIMDFKYQVSNGSSLVLFYPLDNFNVDKKADDPDLAKVGLYHMPEQVKAFDVCVKWTKSQGGIRQLGASATGCTLGAWRGLDERCERQSECRNGCPPQLPLP